MHYVFDSLFSRKIQQDVIHQIAAYSFCPENESIIHVMTVQQQKNGVDYGLFSIAFARSLAFGKDPSNSTYDSAALRPHLINCLTSRRIAPFPKVEERVVRCKPSTHTVEIFCSCRGYLDNFKTVFFLFFFFLTKRFLTHKNRSHLEVHACVKN